MKITNNPHHHFSIPSFSDKNKGQLKEVKDKSKPYITDKHVKNRELVNVREALDTTYNFKAYIPNSDRKIECRHLAASFIEESMSAASYEGSLQPSQAYSSATKVADTVGIRADERYETIVKQGAAFNILPLNDFGSLIADSFTKIGAGQHKWLLLETGNHAMAVELKVKVDKNTGENKCVVKFFDPNITTAVTRCEIPQKDADNFRSDEYSLSAFITPDWLPAYIGVRRDHHIEKEFIAIECGNHRTKKTGDLGTFKSMEGNITDTMMFHALASGRTLGKNQKTALKNMDVRELQEVLEARNHKSEPGLHMAVQNGHANSIRSLAEVLIDLPKEKRVKLDLQTLLMAKTPGGPPGFHMALQKGNAETIDALGDLLVSLPKDELLALDLQELLTAKNPDGTPGLYKAMQNGNGDAIRSLGALLKKLPPEALAKLDLNELLLGSDGPNGPPALYIAMQDGNEESIKAYGELLNSLPPAALAKLDINKLLSASDKHGISALYTASINGHHKAIKAFGNIVKNLPDRIKEKIDINSLLMGRSSDGTSALHTALSNGHGNAIVAFGTVVADLYPDFSKKLDLQTLLVAKDGMGTPGLYWPMDKGDTRSVKAFDAMLQRLPQEAVGKLRMKELLVARPDKFVDRAGKPNDFCGYTTAKRKGNTETITQYNALLKKYPACTPLLEYFQSLE
jgi:ankyrin repeat protein